MMTNAKEPILLARKLALLGSIVFTCILASCGQQTQNAPTESYKLEHFAQEITSSADHLALTVNQSVHVPVTIKNPTSDTWFAQGKLPVVASFKWFSGGQMLPIEGDRTFLAQPKLAPNESIKQDILVVAPSKPGNYDLNITLVQESITWFNLAGAKPLVIPATVK